MDDSVIIDLYWSRDERAITETDKKYGAYCYRIAMNILKNQNDSEECVNSTYLNAWNAMPPERPNILCAFLGRITRNLSIQYLRGKNAKKRGEGDIPLSFEELSECIPDSLSDQYDGSRISAQDLAELINTFLRGLSTDARLVFIGRYYYLESIKDISSRLGFKEGKVKTLLFRTRNGLREFLEKEGVDI